jgi:transcriptional regulator with XRE-family HTH domain
MRIGEVLKRTRTRQGIEIREVEERTKIRTKYLRALESEDWELLPNPAYAKGFLRTYAQLLGLDADAIVDEYRRQVESELPSGDPLRIGEPVLEARRRPPGSEQRRWGTGALVALGVAAAVVVLVVIGLVSGDDESGSPEQPKTAEEKREQRRQQRQRENRREQRKAATPAAGDSVTLALTVRQDVQVCLLGGGGEVLIPGQVLSAGTEERFEQPRFDLRFPSGYDVEQFSLELNGERARLGETTGPAAFEIEPGSKPARGPPPGAQCP